MKDKIIKNIGIIFGTSNLVFAGSGSNKEPKIQDEEVEKKQEFIGMCDLLSKHINGNVDSKQLTLDIFNILYKCEKKVETINKVKKNTLNYSLNFGIKIEDVKDFFKGKIKIDKDKKNIIVLKKNPIIVPIQGTEKEILDNYRSLLKEECIILELNNDCVVDKLYNTTLDNDKKEISDKINGKPEDEKHDIKEIFDKASNLNNVGENVKAIVKALNDAKIGYGITQLNNENKGVSNKFKLDNSSAKNSYIVLLMDNNNNPIDITGTITYTKIKANIKSYIKNVALGGLTPGRRGNLAPEDIIICYNKIGEDDYILIAKAEDVSKGKVGEQTINPEFYISSLEELFNKEFIFPKIEGITENEKKINNDTKAAFKKHKIDKGIYDFNQFDNEFKTLINKYLITNMKPNIKGNEVCWNVMENKENGIGYCNGSCNAGKFVKNREKLEKFSIAGSTSTSGNLNEKCVIFALNTSNNKFMVADFNDIVNGTVNNQTIDDSFYVKPTPVS